MKKVSFTILTIALMACFTLAEAQIKTPAASPASKLTQTVGLTDITIEYNRPSKKGRVIFGGLEQFGEMWRTGANKNTMISFSEDVKVSGIDVKKGTYAIFTVPGEKSWEIVLYTDTENWGVPKEWDAKKEAARFTATPTTLPNTVETMLIDINDIKPQSCMVYLMWDKTSVGFPIELGTNDQVNADIKRLFDGPTANDYYQAGRFYLDSGQDINKAYEWLSKANEMEPKFWRLRHESRALAQMGQYKKAIEVAERSKKMAEEAGNKQYVKFNNDSIAEWKSKM